MSRKLNCNGSSLAILTYVNDVQKIEKQYIWLTILSYKSGK
jgi:hypothetical protein